jgi:adenine specific DNA methylase Mod
MFGSEWEYIRQDKFDAIMAVLAFQHINEEEIVLYMEDFSRMTNRVLINGRRFNDDGKKNTWDILLFGIYILFY